MARFQRERAIDSGHRRRGVPEQPACIRECQQGFGIERSLPHDFLQCVAGPARVAAA